MIMPQMDLEPIYGKLQPNSPRSLLEFINSPLQSASQIPIPAYICPSDPSERLNLQRRLDPGGVNMAVGKSNYLGVMGVDISSPADGVFYFRSSVRFRDITDGQSNTFAVGERASQSGKGPHPNNAGVWPGATAFPCTGTTIRECTIANYGNVRFELQTGRRLDTGGLGTVDANGPFSSRHVGGVQFLMCDGAVRLIAENIDSRMSDETDPGTWGTYQYLGVRNDSEVVGEF